MITDNFSGPGGVIDPVFVCAYVDNNLQTKSLLI